MKNEKTFKQKLRDLSLYTEEQLANFTENECKGEYLSCVEQGIAE